jgi:hypothetical protein
MITLKEWMEVVEYRVTEGSTFCWQCYGGNAYSLDSWNNDQDGNSFTIIFDTKTQVVYEVQSHDYKNQRAYRLINPDFKDQREIESTDRSVSLNVAWDEVNYVDLESDDDWIQKALSIIAGEVYDTRVSIPIDLPEEELMVLFKMAHERDLTFNDFVEQILRDALADAGFADRLKEKVDVGY